jgi:hypothetical protein
MTKWNEVLVGKGQKSEQDETHSCLCESQNHQMISNDSKTVYHCPSKCEGDKTYNASGNCPDCKMHLVPTKPGTSILEYKLTQVV